MVSKTCAVWFTICSPSYPSRLWTSTNNCTRGHFYKWYWADLLKTATSSWIDHSKAAESFQFVMLNVRSFSVVNLLSSMKMLIIHNLDFFGSWPMQFSQVSYFRRVLVNLRHICHQWDFNLHPSSEADRRGCRGIRQRLVRRASRLVWWRRGWVCSRNTLFAHTTVDVR